MLRVIAKDYQILRSADLTVNGITFISAPNGRGKSSILKGIKTVLENASSDLNYRHGTTGFQIDIDIDGQVLHYGRQDGQPWFAFNTEDRKIKLGHATMAQLEPRFGLKRIDYTDSHFIPNIAEQNKIPIFSDISVVDLFSTLFASMSKLSQRGTDLKKDVSKSASTRDAVGQNLDFTKAKKLEVETLLTAEATKHPTLEQDYERLSGIHAKKLKYVELSKRVTELSKTCNDPVKIKMVSRVEAARSLFPILQFVQGVSQLIELKSQIQSSIDSLKSQVSELPDSQHASLVTGVGVLIDYKRKLSQYQKQLLNYPPELELYSIIGEQRKLQASIKDYWLAINKLDEEYIVIDARLKEIGCPFLAEGLCPVKSKLGV